MIKSKYKLSTRFNYWYHNLWFMKLSRKIAHSYHRATKFCDTIVTLKEFARSYCKVNTKHSWYYFFVNDKYMYEVLGCLYEGGHYE